MAEQKVCEFFLEINITFQGIDMTRKSVG